MIHGSIEAARGRVRVPGRRWRANLEEAVALWPTPNATDWKGPGNQRSPGKVRPSCDDVLPSRAGGHLNPPWVEWLMGFPLGWTDCEDSGTPWSPKLPSTSAA